MAKKSKDDLRNDFGSTDDRRRKDTSDTRCGTLSRRRFLGGMGAAAVAAAVGCKERSSSVVDVDAGPDVHEDGGVDLDGGPDILEDGGQNDGTVVVEDGGQNGGEQGPDLSILRAFPGAEGGGSMSIGGRGGTVLYVTSLDDDPNNPQPGTFRWACEQSFPRIIVFRISGRICLRSHIFITQDRGNLTIAGQTAPGEGIEITRKIPGSLDHGRPFSDLSDWNTSSRVRGGFSVAGNHVVIRHIRIRPGYLGSDTSGGYSVVVTANTSGRAWNHIYDHCTLGWGFDETYNAQVRNGDSDNGIRNITLQDSIMHEEFQGHSCAVLISNSPGGTTSTEGIQAIAENIHNLDLIRNFAYGYNHRAPAITTGTSIRIINNIWYGWRFRGGRTGAFNTDFIGNIWDLGGQRPDRSSSLTHELYLTPKYDDSSCYDAEYDKIFSGQAIQKVWVEDNMGDSVLQGEDLDDNFGWATECTKNAAHNRNIPLINRADGPQVYPAPLIPPTITPVTSLADSLLPNVGCSRRLAKTMQEYQEHGHWVSIRDGHDQRMVDHYFAGTGGLQIAHEDDVGGFLDMPVDNEPYACSANDGIADWWKAVNGLDVNQQYQDVEIPAGPGVAEGWTYMDLFLAGMNLPT